MSNVKIPDPDFAQSVIDAGGKTLDLCYQCGTCTGSCPSGRTTAFRTRQLIRKAQLGLKDDILPSEDLWMCTTCYSCVERCPRDVESSDIIIPVEEHGGPEGLHGRRPQEGRTLPAQDRAHRARLRQLKALRVSMGLSADPPTTIADPQAMADFKKIHGQTGFEKRDRRCLKWPP